MKLIVHALAGLLLLPLLPLVLLERWYFYERERLRLWQRIQRNRRRRLGRWRALLPWVALFGLASCAHLEPVDLHGAAPGFHGCPAHLDEARAWGARCARTSPPSVLPPCA